MDKEIQIWVKRVAVVDWGAKCAPNILLSVIAFIRGHIYAGLVQASTVILLLQPEKVLMMSLAMVLIFAFIAFISPVDTNEHYVYPCPPECICWNRGSDVAIASCLINNNTTFISDLPKNLTHLLIKTPRDSASNVTDLFPDFNHLTRLQVLLLDNDTPFVCSQKYRMVLNDESLKNCSLLHTFVSNIFIMLYPNALKSSLALRHFHLSNTAMTWPNVSNLMNVGLTNATNLRTLELPSLGRKLSFWKRAIIKVKENFDSLSNIPIRSLNLANNGIHYFTNEFSVVFPKLERLDVRHNMLTYPSEHLFFILLYQDLLHVKEILYSNQGTYDLASKSINLDQYINADEDTEGFMTTSDFQSHNFNQISPQTIANSHIPPGTKCWRNILINLGSIEAVHISNLASMSGLYNNDIYGHVNMCFISPNNLSYIDASYNSQWNFPGLNVTTNAMIYGLDSLEYINLQYGGLENFDPRFPHQFPSLKTVLFGHNNFSTFMGAWNFSLANNTALEVLDLAYNGIKDIPSNSSLHLLVNLKHLNVSGNKLTQWNINISMMTKFEVLNFSRNAFSTVPTSLRIDLEKLNERQSYLNKSKPIMVDFSKNPLSCLCSNFQFVQWIKNTPVNFHNKQTYTCTHPQYGVTSLSAIDVHELHAFCFTDQIRVIILSVLPSVIATAALASMIALYCKRWHVRYLWYMAQYDWRKHQDATDEREYEFDVFVAHSTEDEDWVRGPLLQELETKRGLRLCLYQRDIFPSEVLVHALCDRIEKSRKVLLVLSPDFVRSNWCTFEMQIAQTRLVQQGRDIIVPVIRKPLPTTAIRAGLFKILMQKVYIEWTDDPDGQELFWIKLSHVLMAASCRLGDEELQDTLEQHSPEDGEGGVESAVHQESQGSALGGESPKSDEDHCIDEVTCDRSHLLSIA